MIVKFKCKCGKCLINCGCSGCVNSGYPLYCPHCKGHPIQLICNL